MSWLPVGLLTLSLTACVVDETADYQACQQSFSQVGVEDAPLDFTALEVVELLNQAPPSQIRWDGMTQTDGQDTLVLEVLGVSGQVNLATPVSGQEFCPAGGESLLINLELELSIAGGEAVPKGILPVYAAALDESQIYMSPTWELPVVLSGTYAESFADFFDAEYGSEEMTLAGVYFSAVSQWSEGALDISFNADGEDLSLVGTAWRGHWQ